MNHWIKLITITATTVFILGCGRPVSTGDVYISDSGNQVLYFLDSDYVLQNLGFGDSFNKNEYSVSGQKLELHNDIVGAIPFEILDNGRKIKGPFRKKEYEFTKATLDDLSEDQKAKLNL